MAKLPASLTQKLEARKADSALRSLSNEFAGVDFSSNDYLGFSRSQTIFASAHKLLADNSIAQNGATGSRLITGNHPLYATAENLIADFHKSESALIFNSGYDANVGFFSSVPQRGDVILFDELCHASIRDGIRLSNAKAFKFAHNDVEELEVLLARFSNESAEIYIATESVFSMDGDSPNLEQLAELSSKYKGHLIVDEAHAIGVFGDNGEGLVQMLGLSEKVFARIMTFGKGVGCHGAAVLGSRELSDYLVNFARSFIYTTGIPPHSVATIIVAYDHLRSDKNESRESLREKINFFNSEKMRLGLRPLFVRSKSAIQSAIIPGNEKVRSVAKAIQESGFDVRAILSPTVPQGQERLRICLHSYNSNDQIAKLLEILSATLL